MIEAASAGASMSIKLVANIAANLIAFLALLQFVNETLKWLGARAGLGPPDYPDFTFEVNWYHRLTTNSTILVASQ